METKLAGKRVLVCGASSGIGRATALALAAAGPEVIVLARRQDELEDVRVAAKEAGASAAHLLAIDLEDENAIRDVIGQVLDQLGPVHVLVNNAGGPPAGRLLEAEREDLMKAFARHVLASHTLVKLLLPGMVAEDYGRIVNIVSTSVYEPIPNLGVSNTIRAAMAGWAKTLSSELPPGVTINNVLPGYTATDRLRALGEANAERTGRTYEDVEADWIASIPEGRLARPEEVAAMIAFLASPAAGYVRGQSIAVDGGRTRSI